MTDTNIDDLEMRCDTCGHRAEPRPYAPWPRHCGQPMRCVNLTDRDGNPTP